MVEERRRLAELGAEIVDPGAPFVAPLPQLAGPAVARHEGQHRDAVLARMGQLERSDRTGAIAAFLDRRHPAAAERHQQQHQIAAGQRVAAGLHGGASVGAAMFVQQIGVPMGIEHHVACRLAPGLQVLGGGRDEDALHGPSL